MNLIRSRIRSRTYGVGLLACAVLVVGGCRGIVGIEDLTVETTDAGDASADASDAGAVADAKPDQGTDPTGCALNNRGDVGACRGCCKDANKDGNKELEKTARDSGCICANEEGCKTVCKDTACADPPPPTEQRPSEPCVRCLDDRLASSSCAEARAQCALSSKCAALGVCLTSCQ